MNILLIDCDMGELPGHAIRKISLEKAGIVPVQRLLNDPALEGGAFQPDLILQMEHIGRRIFLSGLSQLHCTKIFWAVDSHLNLFWQRWYAKLFDVVLTPHKSLFDAQPPAWRPSDTRSFTMPGYARAWQPHSSRSHAASFVGRIDQNRPQRFRFSRLLEQRHGVAPCILPFHDMLDLYDNTRIIPNESICREFNFRIMEGASCGCCVLTEDIGDDLAVNFEPGKEVLTYRHALEFEELFSFLAARPTITENIGKAARQRVSSSHLMSHRRAELIKMLPSLAAQAYDPHASDRVFALTCLQWARSNPAYEKHIPDIRLLLEKLPPHPDLMAMQLRLLLEDGRSEDARKLLRSIVENPALTHAYTRDQLFDLHTACAVTTLRLGEWALFPVFWEAQKHLSPHAPAPASSFQACLAWAQLLLATGRICQPGFHFDPTRHCPESAFEMTQMAQLWVTDQESARQWTRQMAECCDKTPFHHLALEYKARISLDSPNDWRACLDYAMACLKTFLLEEGLDEAAIAYAGARHAGQAEDFAITAEQQVFQRL